MPCTRHRSSQTLATCHAHLGPPRVPTPTPRIPCPLCLPDLRRRRSCASSARSMALPSWCRTSSAAGIFFVPALVGPGGTEPVGHARCLAGRRAAGVCWRDGVCGACGVTPPTPAASTCICETRTAPWPRFSRGGPRSLPVSQVPSPPVRWLWPAFWVGSFPAAADTTPLVSIPLVFVSLTVSPQARRGAYGDRGAVGHSHRGPRAWAHRSKPAGRIQGRRLDGGCGIRVLAWARNHGELLGW